MTNLLTRIAGRARRRLRRDTSPLAHSWRTVESGPLSGLHFYLPSGKDAGWADRFLNGQYEPEMLAALAELAKEGGILYDIGAHIGYYTCAWLHLGGSHVEAFEPAPYNREVLQATLQRNSLGDKAQIHPFALGDKEGVATLVASSVDVGAASAAFIPDLGKAELPPVGQGPLPGIKRITVPVRRLDDLYKSLQLPVPSVIKLDVEGAEGAILAGAADMIEETRPAILCEVHNTEVGLQIAHRLANLQYDMRILGKNGPHPACLWVQK